MSFASQLCWQRRDVAHGSVFTGRRAARTLLIDYLSLDRNRSTEPGCSLRDGQEVLCFHGKTTTFYLAGKMMCLSMENVPLNPLKPSDQGQFDMWSERVRLLLEQDQDQDQDQAAPRREVHVKMSKDSVALTADQDHRHVRCFFEKKSLSVEQYTAPSVAVRVGSKQRDRLFSWPAARRPDVRREVPSRRDGWVLAPGPVRSAASGRWKEPNKWGDMNNSTENDCICLVHFCIHVLYLY